MSSDSLTSPSKMEATGVTSPISPIRVSPTPIDVPATTHIALVTAAATHVDVDDQLLIKDEEEKDVFLSSFPPGYRFSPFDEELILHYLVKKVKNQVLPPNKIKDVNIYRYNPEDLAQMYKKHGEDGKEWYFFTPRDKKYPNGTRPNRAAGDGFWKATGADKSILNRSGRIIGLRKALVFYRGKAPKGEKTNWIMHEFRTPDGDSSRASNGPRNMQLDKWVLCRIYEKNDRNPKPYDRSPKSSGKTGECLDISVVEDDEHEDPPQDVNEQEDIVPPYAYDPTEDFYVDQNTNLINDYNGLLMNDCTFNNFHFPYLAHGNQFLAHNMGIGGTQYYTNVLPYSSQFQPFNSFNAQEITDARQDISRFICEGSGMLPVKFEFKVDDVCIMTGEVPLFDYPSL